MDGGNDYQKGQLFPIEDDSSVYPICYRSDRHQISLAQTAGGILSRMGWRKGNESQFVTQTDGRFWPTLNPSREGETRMLNSSLADSGPKSLSVQAVRQKLKDYLPLIDPGQEEFERVIDTEAIIMFEHGGTRYT